MSQLRSVLATIAFLAAGLIPLAAGAAPVQTPAATDPMNGLYACTTKLADSDRLACFDVEVKHLQQSQHAGDIAVVDKTRVEAIRKEAFGFTLPSLPKLLLPKFDQAKEAGLTANVISLKSADPPVFQLDNGQTWIITDTASLPYQLKAGATVEISRASLGSFLLQVKGSGAGLRVKRIG